MPAFTIQYRDIDNKIITTKETWTDTLNQAKDIATHHPKTPPNTECIILLDEWNSTLATKRNGKWSKES